MNAYEMIMVMFTFVNIINGIISTFIAISAYLLQKEKQQNEKSQPSLQHKADGSQKTTK